MLDTSQHLTRRTLAHLAAFLFVAMLALPGLAYAQAPQVVDDFRTVLIGDVWKTVLYDELLANDTNVDGATVTVVRHALRGQSVAGPDGIVFEPDDDFWSLESDLVVYRVDTAGGSAFGTLYFASERGIYATTAPPRDFEDPNAPLPGGVGVAHDTTNPLIGSGSLVVQPASTTDDAYLVLPIDGDVESNVNSGETDGCAGGLATLTYDSASGHAAVGYLVLIGDENATIDTAQVRAGVTHQGDFFVESRLVDDHGMGDFQRSDLLTPGNDTVRFNVSFALENNYLVALLRADGLAVRSPHVEHTLAGPTHVKLGFFQPDGGSGSTPDLIFDDITVGATGLGALAQLSAIYDPIQQADDLEDGTLGAWTATHGAGVIQDAASFVTGDLGLGITQFANGPTFASYQTPAYGLDDTRFRKLTARAEFDLSSFSIDPQRLLRLIEIGSDAHALFGVTDFELRVFVDATSASGFGLRPAFRRDNGDGTYTWFDGNAVPLDTLSTRLALQVGRSDSDAVDNGWLRLWVDGEIASELFGLDNDDQVLHNVHFGAKGFVPAANAAGTIRIDDVLVTR